MTDVRARSNPTNEVCSARTQASDASGSLLPIVERPYGLEEAETA